MVRLPGSLTQVAATTHGYRMNKDSFALPHVYDTNDESHVHEPGSSPSLTRLACRRGPLSIEEPNLQPIQNKAAARVAKRFGRREEVKVRWSMSRYSGVCDMVKPNSAI
jgi:hypothetical protein